MPFLHMMMTVFTVFMVYLMPWKLICSLLLTNTFKKSDCSDALEALRGLAFAFKWDYGSFRKQLNAGIAEQTLLDLISGTINDGIPVFNMSLNVIGLF